MKVLHVFSDPRLGGPGTRTLDIACNLRSSDVESVFVIPEGGNSLSDVVKERGGHVERIQLPRLRSPRRIRDNLRFFTEFRQTVNNYGSLIDRINADIVHVNTPYNFHPAIAASRSPAKLVWHFNDSLTPIPLKIPSSAAAKIFADTIVADSKRVIDYYSLPDEETQVLYPCVNYSKFDAGPIPDFLPFGRGDEKPTIGCVGNLNPVKGQDKLLRALPRIIENIGSVTVRFVGARLESQTRYYDRLQQIVTELGLEEYVDFVGRKSEIPGELSAFDLFVLPSLSESGPIVLLEAMAAGVPVVTTDVGIVSEQVEDGRHAWVVPPKSVEPLANATIDALRSPGERNRRAKNAKELVKDRFSAEKISQQYLQMYCSLLN